MMEGVSYWALFWWLSLSMSLGAGGRNISTSRPYYDPKLYYDDYVYSDENGNFPEPDYEEDLTLPKLGTRIFKYWPKDFYDYRHSLNLPVPQEEWNNPSKNYWPPRREDGVEFENATGDYNLPDNIRIREEYYALQKKYSDKYAEDLRKLQEKVVDYADDKNFILPRSYPFCVDGKLGRHLIPDKFKWTGEAKFNNIDPRLERFIPILRTAQPTSGIPVFANIVGKPPITHVEDGIEMGPYVERMYFSLISNNHALCAYPYGNNFGHVKDYHRMMGFDTLVNWMLIRVHTRVPLEGLFIQAIGWPNGLPFGNFRNDVDCTEEKEWMYNPRYDHNGLSEPLDMSTLNRQEFLTLEGKRVGEYVIRKRQTTSVPCKYGYGDNSVELPEVFAYGGSVPDLDEDVENPDSGFTQENRIIWEKRDYFQTAMTFNHPNCHGFTHFQLIVIAVKDFANMKYEVFRTLPYFFYNVDSEIQGGEQTAFIHNMVHPYHKSWGKNSLNCGAARASDDNFWGTKCNPVWQFAGINVKDWRWNNEEWYIFPNWEYDNCIRGSGEEEDAYRKERDVRMSRTGRMSGLWPNHLCGPKPTSNDNGKHARCVQRSKLGLCPPSGHFCHNSKYRSDREYLPGRLWGEFREQAKVFDNRKKLNTEIKCVVQSCPNPNYTIPELFVEVRGGGDDDDYSGGDDDNGGNNGGAGSEEGARGAGGGFGVGSGSGGKDRLGTKFSEAFTKKFYTNGAVYVRRVKSVHTMTMYLAWMTLMGMATLTARYYKETGGINPEAGNSCLGIGFWIWSHYFLFVFSLIFMWIGIITSHSIRRRKVPCNAYDVYKSNTTDLMQDCRYNNQVVRVHKVFGFLAAFLFHWALLVAWARPTGALRLLGVKINLRKLGVWTHVLAAYLGKMLCIFSVIVFLLPRASSVCNDIPTWIILTEVLTVALFAALCVIQWMEDKADKKNDKTVFPVLEAVEAADKSGSYKIKLIVIVVSVLLHVIFFVLTAISTAASYGKSSLVAARAGDKTMGQGKAEILQGLFSSKCSVPSLASEEDIRMRQFYYTNKYKQ